MNVSPVIQHKKVFARPTAPSYGAGEQVRFSASDGVKLLAVHWHLESIDSLSEDWIAVGLCADPTRRDIAYASNVDFEQDPDIYAQATWYHGANGTPTNTQGYIIVTQVIPCYGFLVPNVQSFVWAVINGSLSTGIMGEIWYQDVSMSRQEAEILNLEMGKYRR